MNGRPVWISLLFATLLFFALHRLTLATPPDLWECGDYGRPDPCNTWLLSVDMLSGSEGWAVGQHGTTLRWTGSDWIKITSPVTDTLRAVSMVAADDGWAVGSDVPDVSVILHWDGTDWTQVSSPTTQPLSHVDMLSATDGWAVGWSGTILQIGRASCRERV